MDSHELAKALLEKEATEVTVSVDISTTDDDAGSRVFSDDLISLQYEGDGSVTFLFELGYTN